MKSWAMHKLGVEEWLVSAVMSMYTGAKTVVTTVYGNSKGFEVKVGMHQGSALSPLLFVIVMEAISREFRVALPWELLYADDLESKDESHTHTTHPFNGPLSRTTRVSRYQKGKTKSGFYWSKRKRLNEWKENVESKGMRVNMNKTKVTISGERQMVRQKADGLDSHAGSAVKVLVAIHYSVLDARNGYIRNVVV